MEKSILVYTDGSSIGNGSVDSKCGWACKLMYNGSEMYKSGFEIGKTNNYMEVLAVLNAMKSINNKTIPCIIVSDSQYVVKTMNKEFRVGKNVELWEEIFLEMNKFLSITIKWVRGHDKDSNNLKVDELAYKTALQGE